MKRSDLFFIAILLPLDAAMIVLAFLAAYYLRLSQGDATVAANAWPLSQYLTFVGTLTPFWLPIFALIGLYSLKKLRRFLPASATPRATICCHPTCSLIR